MEFLDKNIVFDISSRYGDLYNLLVEASKGAISNGELFILSASIGYKEARKEVIKEKSQTKQIPLSNLRADYGSIIYMILLEDEQLFIQYEDLLDELRFSDYKRTIEEYAEGGMTALLEYALPPNIGRDGRAREEYIYDIFVYIMSEIKREN